MTSPKVQLLIDLLLVTQASLLSLKSVDMLHARTWLRSKGACCMSLSPVIVRLVLYTCTRHSAMRKPQSQATCTCTNMYMQAKPSNMNHRLIHRVNERGDSERNGVGPYQLDMDLASLHFTHHPLFSLEHVLASRLEQSWEQYSRRARDRPAQYYRERVSRRGELHVLLVVWFFFREVALTHTCACTVLAVLHTFMRVCSLGLGCAD